MNWKTIVLIYSEIVSRTHIELKPVDKEPIEELTIYRRTSGQTRTPLNTHIALPFDMTMSFASAQKSRYIRRNKMFYSWSTVVFYRVLNSQEISLSFETLSIPCSLNWLINSLCENIIGTFATLTFPIISKAAACTCSNLSGMGSNSWMHLAIFPDLSKLLFSSIRATLHQTRTSTSP